jgi:hypothetical protein
MVDHEALEDDELDDDEDMYPSLHILEEIADIIREWPAEWCQQMAVEWEAGTANLTLPLGRTVFDHVVLMMNIAGGRGVDPGLVIDAFVNHGEALVSKERVTGDE